MEWASGLGININQSAAPIKNTLYTVIFKQT